MRHVKIFSGVLALCLLLTGCVNSAKKQAQTLLEGIEPRDETRYIRISMTSDITYDDGAHYDAVATWEDVGGVRHLVSCEANIMGKATTAEAWADKNAGMTYVYTDDTGWFGRGYTDNADAVPALDLDAALSYIGRMARTDGAAKAEAHSSGNGGQLVEWDAAFSDVKKMAGDYGRDIVADSAHVTAEFNSDGMLTRVLAVAESGNGARFDVEIMLTDWNVAHDVLAVPDEIIKECTKDSQEPEFSVDMPKQDPMVTYTNIVTVPGEFEDEVLTMFLNNITSSGEDFDKIEAVPISGGNELQYHTHGIIGSGYWFGVVAIDGYGPGGATSRFEELAAYNDAWYGGRIENLSAPEAGWNGLASWSSMHPNEQAYKLEFCFLYGDVCADVQIEAYLADDVSVENLLEHGMYMLRTAGLCE